MRSSEWSGRVRLTAEQRERLKHITNPTQRARLLQAIAAGEEIPDYAWEPVSEELAEDLLKKTQSQVSALSHLKTMIEKASLTIT